MTAFDPPPFLLRDHGEGTCSGESDFQAVMLWTDCEFSAQVIVTVICRTCGERDYPVCLECMAHLVKWVSDPDVRTYCTDFIKPHEVIGVRSVQAF